MPLALVGFFILINRIIDVFTDPLMGFISDHPVTLRPAPPLGGAFGADSDAVDL